MFQYCFPARGAFAPDLGVTKAGQSEPFLVSHWSPTRVRASELGVLKEGQSEPSLVFTGVSK